jgi:hypothetical protein
VAGYDEANTAMIQAALDRAGDGKAAAAAEIAAAGRGTLLASGDTVVSDPPPELTGEQFGTHLVERFVGQGAAATASWWTASAAAWTESFGLAMRGEYSAERLRADGAGAWSRYRGLLSSLVGVSTYAPGPADGLAASDTSLLVPPGQG